MTTYSLEHLFATNILEPLIQVFDPLGNRFHLAFVLAFNLARLANNHV